MSAGRSVAPLTLVPGIEEHDPQVRAHDQAIEAIDAIRRPAGDYLHMPWRPLDALVGGMPPGDVWYVGGYSGDGKTTLLTSLTLDGVRAGWRVYYLGLESRAHVIRTHFACQVLSLNAGDLLSGAYLAWENAAEVRERVRVELRRMSAAAVSASLRVSEARQLTPQVVRAEYLSAAVHGAQVVIVDHVDHLADAVNQKAASDAVNGAILELTQQLGVVTIAASQFNLDAVRGDRMLRHLPPRENVWKFGNRKREVASGQLAIYRPLRSDGVGKTDMAAFRAGVITAREVCEPNTMACYVVKHRLYGDREHRHVLLGVQAGRVVTREQHASLPYSLRGNGRGADHA